MTDMKTVLGLELGSTRIKAVAINENFVPVSSGDYTWKSSYENGVWTYDLAEVWKGLKTAVSGVENRETVKAMGVSAMMHGYLAFDKDWNLLVPFRTWQNTITGQAAAELTEAFNFNVPQRWSISHLYQAVCEKAGTNQAEYHHRDQKQRALLNGCAQVPCQIHKIAAAQKPQQ